MFLLYLAGCTTALHIGKIPAAIPLLQDVWQLSLTQSGLIISLHSILIATCGLLLGLLIRRLGYVPFAIIGVGIVGVGSLLGSFAQSLPLLLVGRSIEGLGWIISVIVLPSLISALSTAKDRPLVMALWASFLPVGAGMMLLYAPTLQSRGGWQLSWLFGSGVSFLAAIVVYLITRKYGRELSHLGATAGPWSFSDLTKRVVWLLSGCFLLYSFSYIPLISFLPLLLVETSHLTIGWASSIAALVMLCNSVGSVSAGIFLRRGYSASKLLMIGAFGSGVCAVFIFAPFSTTGIRIIFAFAFSMFGGVVPGILFSTMPKAASHPSSVGLLIGLMMQLAGIGMLLGGVVIPGTIEYFNAWIAAGWVTLITGSCCAFLAYLIGKQAFSLQ
ncbi:MAG: MFS family permease [Granulosicoccus sp.]